jgi:outer membrane protein insertion porin family
MNLFSNKRIALFVLCFALAPILGSAASAEIVIDEVKVVGAPSEQVDSLRTLSGILPGDEYEVARIQRTLEKLKEYLEGRGYPQAHITSELVKGASDPAASSVHERNQKRVLLFHVEMGAPIEIAKVAFSSKDTVLSADMTEKLLKSVELKVGEPFDRERIKEMRRSVETTLTAMNFVDSHVADIVTDAVDGGFKITFVIEIGQKVIFSVYGNQYFTRSELMVLIDEQQGSGLGRDYVNVILGRLRDRYIDFGFRYVSITPYTFESQNREPRKVAYEIDEGPQVRLKKIYFDGNESFTEDELERMFFNTAPDRIHAHIFNEKMIEESARSMIEELKKRGFLSAKLIAIKTEETDSRDELNVRFFINEGLQTRVQAIDFRNQQVFTNEQLTEFLAIHEGDPLSLVQLEDGLERIKRQYRNLGYLEIKITNESNQQLVTYSEKNQYAYLNFEIDEGRKIRYAGFTIFGNEKTRSEVISREIQLRVDEPLAENKLIETEDRLRRLGVFSQVNVELQDHAEKGEAKDLKISVQEATPGNMGAGVGFRSDLGLRVFGEVSYSNLWGMNHGWVLNLSANRRVSDFRFVEFAAQASYIWPWFMLGETTMRPSITAERRQYREFDAETMALSDSLERMLYKPIKLSGALTYTIEQIRQFNAQDATQNQQVRIGSITPLLRLDLRDNPLAPRRGFFALTSLEYANSFLGTQTDPVPVRYGRFQFRADGYLDLIPRVIWYASVRGGYLKNFVNPFLPDGSRDSRVTIPLIKQFALGGVNSLRGYIEQELNVQADDPERRVQGYMTYVNYRTQLDFLLSQNLSVGPFLDAGNLQVDAFSMGNLRYGTGLGLRYLTPVGPVNFDWGFKLFPKANEDSNVFYFSLGVI